MLPISSKALLRLRTVGLPVEEPWVQWVGRAQKLTRQAADAGMETEGEGDRTGRLWGKAHSPVMIPT